MEMTQMKQVTLHLEGALGFDRARQGAEQLAADSIANPMLIAWYDGIRGEEHPEVPECQHQPGWLAYAEGHGGQLRVDVNDGAYSFIFADTGSVIE